MRIFLKLLENSIEQEDETHQERRDAEKEEVEKRKKNKK